MTTARAGERIAAVDAARGAAIIGMVVFHLAWDLHDFGWIAVDPSSSTGWELFGHAVAACFLVLSGFGLVLARRNGAGYKAALRRIAVIAGAALGVTLVTSVASPGETVRFGILHCIALSNLLSLPLMGMPPGVVLAVAAAALVTPSLVADRAPTWLWWLGLSDSVPATIDVRPLLPWFGVVLLGVWFGLRFGVAPVRRWMQQVPPAPAVLTVAGRHSLAIYLVHQPIMFGILAVLALSYPRPRPDAADQAAFSVQCEVACVRTTPADQCALFCACARRHLETSAARRTPTQGDVTDAARLCGPVVSKPLDLHGP